MHLSHLVNENTVIDAKVQLITTVFLHIEKRAWRYFVVYSLYIHARASLPSVWRGRYKNAAYRPIHYRTHYTSNMSEDHIHNAINVISLSCTLIYPLQMSLEIWKVGQLPTEIGRSKNKKYVLSNSESVQCNFFIFDHVTFIQFKICCCVQNLIKIGWFFYWDMAIYRFSK